MVSRALVLALLLGNTEASLFRGSSRNNIRAAASVPTPAHAEEEEERELEELRRKEEELEEIRELQLLKEQDEKRNLQYLQEQQDILQQAEENQALLDYQLLNEWDKRDLQYSPEETLLQVLEEKEKGEQALVHRSLVDENSFTTLACNAGLEDQECNTLWSNYVGSGTLHTGKVTIACGDCVKFDADGITGDLPLTLQGGLDIQGKLVFPDGTLTTIETPFVIVQGYLDMTSSKVVDGQADIRFVFTGTSPVQFTPSDTNAFKGTQDIGKKGFVVAGGQININGLPSADTPTWVPLYDVSDVTAGPELDPSEYATPRTLPSGCGLVPIPLRGRRDMVVVSSEADIPGYGVFVNETFSSPPDSIDTSTIFGSFGSTIEYTGDSLLVKDRTHWRHGLVIDMKKFSSCLATEVDSASYIFTARVKLTKEGIAAGMPTECAATGNGCLELQSEWMRDDEGVGKYDKYKEKQSFQLTYGEWFTIAEHFEFNDNELGSDHVYNTLRLHGPSAGVEMELDNIVFRLPPKSGFRSAPVCADLVPANGQADAVGDSPFPMYSNWWLSQVGIQEEGGNKFFAVTGRHFHPYTSSYSDDKAWTSMQFDFPAGCVKQGSRYRFSMQVRAHPSAEYPDPGGMEVYIKGYHDHENDRSYTRVTTCPLSSEWATCAADFEFTESMTDRNPIKYSVYFQTPDAKGVNYDADDIEFKILSGPLKAIVVSDSIKGKWDVGAEILLTSNTLDWDDQQVRHITSITDHSAGYVTVGLSAVIPFPTPQVTSPDYASEAALLSRNIVFEGAKDDSTVEHGAHFMIMETPNLPQLLVGAEFRNFGQQKLLARHAINIYMCGDVPGVLIAKNLIRDSNQRCVVVQGSNYANIMENVAYNTFGHCFMTEDGSEHGVVFDRNLGALTKNTPSSKRIPRASADGSETDDNAATFYIASPNNTWTRNVGAGSQSDGFWINLRSSVRSPSKVEYPELDPRKTPLTEFSDNVAHSNSDIGVRVYYYRAATAGLLNNTRSYRNRDEGVYFSASRFLVVFGGVFADNSEQLNFRSCENTILINAKLECVSDDYNALIQRQPGIRKHCPSDMIVGFEAATYIDSTKYYRRGAYLYNVSISGFERSPGCEQGEIRGLRFGPSIRTPHFDYFSTVNTVDVSSFENNIDLCPAMEKGVKDIVIDDFTSSLKPPTASFAGRSSIVSNSNWMTDLLENCVEVADLCYSYCNSCLRTITYRVNPAETEGLRLGVCDRTTNRCTAIEGIYHYEYKNGELDPYQNTETWKHRTFSASLPNGTFEAAFIEDGTTNPVPVWPTYVEVQYEDNLCGFAWTEDDIDLFVPVPAEGECDSLIKNGDAESSDTDHLYWLHRGGGVRLVEGAGLDGSNAFGDVTHTSDWDAIGQYLDTRCLEVGKMYEVTAWVKLVDATSGEAFTCNRNEGRCPLAGLYYRYPDPTSVTVPGGGLPSGHEMKATSKDFARTTWHHSPSDFQLVHGIITVTQAIADSSSVLFFIRRNVKNYEIYIDNVTVALHTPTDDCSNLVYNGDFASGGTEYWDNTNDDLFVVQGVGGAGDYALSTFDGDPEQYIRSGCMQEGKLYEVSLRYKLLDGDGSEFNCEGDQCPKMYLRTSLEGHSNKYQTIARVAGGLPDTDGWSRMYGLFTANDMQGNSSSQMKIYFQNYYGDTHFVIDDVSIREKPEECEDEMVLNAAMELGYNGLWKKYGSFEFGLHAGVGSSMGVSARGRGSTSTGPEYEARYFMDHRCFEAGSSWQVSADLKLLVAGTNDGASCDTSTTSTVDACPSVRFYVYNASDSSSMFSERIYENAYASLWDSNDFNHFQGTVTIPSDATEVSRVILRVRDFATSKDLVMDNFSVKAAAPGPPPTPFPTAQPTLTPTVTTSTPPPTAQPTLTPTVAPTAQPTTSTPTLTPTTSTPTVTPTKSPTLTPTLTPTTPVVVTPDPTASPTVSPTPGATPFENVCPGVGGTRTVAFPDRPFAISSNLCTLTKVTTDIVGEVTAVVPLARSYENNPWESAGGSFAASVFAHTSFVCSAGLCTFTAPPLDPGDSLVLSTYSHSVSQDNERARFLEMTTFGPQRGDLDGWSHSNFASWVSQQMSGVSLTSHREYWRERSNPRWVFSQRVGRSDHPCDAGSRWRRFAFTRKDRYRQSVFPSGYLNVIGSGGTGPYILSIDGHPRTVVQDLSWHSSTYQTLFPTWNQSHAYRICAYPQEWTGGRLWLQTEPFTGDADGSCQEVTRTVGNPAIDFTGYESHMSIVYNLTNADTLTVIDAWKDLASTRNDDMYILSGGINDQTFCDSLPEQAEDYDAPIFVNHPQEGTLVWDPRLILEDNTAASPIADGGGSTELATVGNTLCSNVPRTFLNADSCVLSTAETGCTAASTPTDIEIELNSTNILQLHSLTGRYIYAMQGLRVKNVAFNEEIDHPCTVDLRSRWEKTANTTCTNPTTLGTTTNATLFDLISNAGDMNPVIRDITFTSANSCDAGETEVEIEIQVGADCWTHVHPEHLSVWDLSYWTLPTTHPGNAYALSQGHPHPIKKWLNGGSHILVYPSTHPIDSNFNHPMARWEANYHKFEYVGRLYDTVNYRTLPNELRLEQVVAHYGIPADPLGNYVPVCGSPGEVTNNPSVGSDFDLTSYTSRDTTSTSVLDKQREIVWTMVALYSQDQLRQRMAWALSQILAIAKTAIPVHQRNTEIFLQYYDIFVRHAFGNYLDILREISYSPLMAENLSYLESKSYAFVWENSQIVQFADENFAREIMQLFSTGLVLLNNDGTPKLDANNNTQQVYDNDDIRSFSRVWTGFLRQENRGNIEVYDNRNRLDPMQIDAEWRDRFPKSDLYGGFLGDGYALCVDLPSQQFLRKGAKYRLLGSSKLPELASDDSRFTQMFNLSETTSTLQSLLCNLQGGTCTYPMEVTLSSNIACDGDECFVDTVRVVQVSPGVFYEYIAPPCVEHSFFDNAMKLNREYKSSRRAVCGNPLLPVGDTACCELPLDSYIDAVSDRFYEIERVTFATQDARCIALGRASCDYDRVDQGASSYLNDEVFHWSFAPCNIQVKVNPVGEAAIVHDMSHPGGKVHHVNDDTRNFFRVPWVNDVFPEQTIGDCGVCQTVEGTNCLCETSVSEAAVFSGPPADSAAILSSLHIGAPDPDSFDAGTYTATTVNGFTVHVTAGGYDVNAIFEVTDSFGRTRFLKNAESTVTLEDGTGTPAGFSFRNPVQFMSLIPSEATARDAVDEVEAMLWHLFTHDNTAPFLCVRFMQRLGNSNPSPRYVSECTNAFRTGHYNASGVSFGSGNYGDLAAATAAVVLDREARSVVLDVDPSHGSLREPLLRVIALMRSMEFEAPDGVSVPGASPLVVFNDMDEFIGEMAHEYPTVFAFFLSEYTPEGPVATASLVAPETQLLDMPKTVNLINGMHSMIMFGMSQCEFGFGYNLPVYSGGCTDGYANRASGTLTYEPTGTPEQIVDDLSTLLTSGRLNLQSRQTILTAFNDAVTQADTFAGIRIALQLLTTAPEFHTVNTVKFSGDALPAPTTPIPAPNVPYRAIVFLMFAGGCDSYNLLMPRDCSNNPNIPGGIDAYTQYANERNPVHLLQQEMLPVNANNHVGCTNFGIHEELTILQQLYNESDLLFFANVGPLGRPSTKSDYRDNNPTQLFAHNDMQHETKRVDIFDVASATGILGRIADAHSFANVAVGNIAVDTTTVTLVGQPGVSPAQMSVGGSGVRLFMPGTSETMTREERLARIEDLNNHTTPDNSFMASTWSNSLIQSIAQNQQLYDTLQSVVLTEDFPSGSLGGRLETAAKMIKTRQERGVNVDLIYLEYGGWDHHSNLAPNLINRFADVNAGLTAFSNEMKAQGVWDNVTLYQASEFARTVNPNSGAGTDHGWGQIQFMFGGSVNGGKILGQYPEDMSENGPVNLGRGRYIPTTSIDQMFPGIASWTGITDQSMLDMICPNRINFASEFSQSEMFVN